jgi:uncharacterized membrane protein
MPIEKYFAVMLATAIKFIGGPLAGFTLGLTWLETTFFTILGMMLTVLLVIGLGETIKNIFKKFQKTPAKRFNFRTRLAVRLWDKAGMTGIGCFTPILFTPIGGTILALSLKVPIHKILPSMLLWAVIWGFALTWTVYHIVSIKDFLMSVYGSW